MLNQKIIFLEERIVLDAALGDVIYVDINASGDNNGASWANAYTDLQSALAEAALTPDAELINIADGVYKPGLLSSATYVIPDMTTLVGGFGGTTILSGDIGVIGLNTDNINTIVRVNAATVSLEKMTIRDGYNPSTVTFGAGMLATLGSHVTLDKMVFDHNFSNRSGGGIALVDSGTTLTVNQSTFTYNTATLSGGAILSSGVLQEVIINHTIFNNNSTLNNGGAIRTTDTALLNLNHTTFTNNSAQSTGGAVLLLSTTELNISHSLFDHNSTNNTGGAIRADNIDKVNIEYSVFDNNYANNPSLLINSAGGAIFFVESGGTMDVKIDHSQFTNNHTSQATNVAVVGSPGGALAFITTTTQPINIEISHSDFISNHTLGSGSIAGAIFLSNRLFTNSTLSIDHSKFYDNSSQNWGGAIGIARNAPTEGQLTRATITHSDFRNNNAVLGGAIFENAIQQLDVSNSKFIDNSSSNSGGAIYVSDKGHLSLLTLETLATVNMVKNHFDNNSALNGGAITLDDPGVQSITLNMDQNHFNKNAASNLGGAYYQLGGTSWVTDNHFNKNFDVNGDQVVVDLPATVNGYSTSADIIDSLVDLNKKLDDDQISVLV